MSDAWSDGELHRLRHSRLAGVLIAADEVDRMTVTDSG